MNELELDLADVRDDVFAEIATVEELLRLPTDTSFTKVAGVVSVHFVVDRCFLDGTRDSHPITEPDVRRWGISLDDLKMIAGRNGGQIAVDRWKRIGTKARAYQYPAFDQDWVSHLLCPDRIIKADVVGRPLALIPFPETLLLTGDEDSRGRRIILDQCLGLSQSPVTLRPLVLNPKSRDWQILADAFNPHAKRYRRLFGDWSAGVPDVE